MVLRSDCFKKGQILFVREFQHADGNITPKPLVVLNNTGIGEEDKCLFCITTTTQGRKRKESCLLHGYFFIPIETEWFDRDTWILFDRIRTTTVGELVNDIESNKIVCTERQFLSERTLCELMKFVKDLPDLSEAQENEIFKECQTEN